jgi:hypothetical protein
MLPNNPLTQYFRQPAIHIRLPSQGKFYPQGTLAMPPNGELPVLPMTSVDEITYRTPDALFNGSATVSVIQSCIPSIRDPWSMPSTDMDAVLVAIRIASYGHGMDISTTCPACEAADDVTVDLRRVNDSLSVGNYDEKLSIGDLEFYFRPITFKTVNHNNQIQMEQQQTIRSLESLEDADRSEKVQVLMASINEATLSTVASSVAAIKTPTALVTEFEFILDYLKNTDGKIFNQIRDHAIKLKQQSEVKPIDITCSSCNHGYTQPFTLDLSSFFDDAS